VPATPTDPSPEVKLLLARGDSLLRTGDFAAARLFYQRAAEQGHGAGALGVAKTYDPVFLAEAGYRTARGDPAAAARWYAQAAAAGEADATARLARLRGTAQPP
jgi:TPR repeat protein